MQKWAFCVLFVLSAAMLKAQLQVGFKASLNFSDVHLADLESNNVSEVTFENKVGFRAGLVARVNIAQVYVQPEFLFTQLNGRITSTNFEELSATDKYLMHRFDLPIVFGGKIKDFRLFAGPVATFNLNSAADMFDNTFLKGTWNVTAGVGYAYMRLQLDVYYEWATDNYAEFASITIGQEVYSVPLTVRNSQFGFSVSVLF